MVSRLILNVLVLSSLSCIVVFGQIGSFCHQDSDCLDGLQCNSVLCICKIKHVQNGKYCFPVANYDEICWFTDQCDDYRQVCQNTTSGIQRCRCDKFHYYNMTVKECLIKRNLTLLTDQKYFFEKDIETASEKPFMGILGAGLAVGAIGLLGLLVAFYYCCRMHYKDSKFEKELNVLIAKNGGKKQNPPLSSIAERNEKMNDATIGPIFAGGIVMA